jgi:hypothetical protein
MNKVLRSKFNHRISSITGFEFEEFIKNTFLYIHGPVKFIPTRKIRDKGNDGILVEENMIIACYGPTEYDKNDFEKKVKDDYDSYIKYWQSKYKFWRIVVNHPLSPDEIIFINKLGVDNGIWGLDQIINEIETKLNYVYIRKLAKELGIIEKEFLSQDYILEILDDLLDSTKPTTKTIDYTKPVYIETKIDLNFDLEKAIDIKNEYEILCENFTDIHNIFNSYSDEEIERIKYRIVGDFNSLSGTFTEKYKNLRLIYHSKYADSNDDNYKYYIDSIILYTFEQCLFGIKTKEELVK